MLRGSAWAARRDQAFALVEDPQQRHLADWREQRTRRRAELEEKKARRQAEFTALIPAIAAQVAAEVSAAVAAALRTTRVGHHEGLNHAKTTTSAPTTSVADDHDLNRAPATTPTTAYSSTTGPAPHADIQLARKVDLQPEAFTSAIGAPSSATAHEADLALTRVASTSATAYAELESDLTTATPITCSTQCPTRAITVSVPAVAPAATCSLILKRLGGIVPSATTVLGFADAKQVIAAQLSDASLKHLPVSRSFLPERGAPTTTDSFQVRLLHDLRPLPRPLLLDEHHVGDEILLIPCSLLNCFLGGDCPKHPWPPPQMLSLVRCYCSDQISMEEPFSCSQCVHLQMCRPPDRAKFSGKLLLGTLDEKSLRYSICCGSETIQWEIAWTLRYGCDFLIQTDGLRIARMPTFILALVEHLYEFSALSRCGEPWMSWQIQFLVPGTRIASPVYAPLICLKARDELKMRLELSMQTDTNASNICGILLHNMDTCSSLQNIECTWFLASCIQPGTRLFLGTESFMFPLSIEGYIDTNHALLWFTWSLAVVNYPSAVLIEFSKGISPKTIHYFSQLQDLLALIKLQSWPALEAYLSGHNLQYYTQFGSTTWADQTKYRTEDYIESIIVPSFWFGTIGYATIHGSSHFQWFIAWSHTLARAAVRTIHWAGPIISLITTEALASIPVVDRLVLSDWEWLCSCDRELSVLASFGGPLN